MRAAIEQAGGRKRRSCGALRVGSRIAGLILLAGNTLGGCVGASANGGTDPVPVASVVVSLGVSTLLVGESAQATATVKDASGLPLTDRPIDWQSSNPAVARVAGAGAILAVAPGTVTITATSQGKTGSVGLAVIAPSPPAVSTVSVTPSSPSVQVGASIMLTATARDASANTLSGRTFAWSSSNSGVATVSASGLVTAVAAGSADITASTGGVAGSTHVTVTAPPGAGIVFSDDFETGSLTKWNESNSTTQAVITDAARAHGGSRFLRMTYGINGGDGGWLNKYFTPGFRQLYVRYYIRFGTNFVGGTKLIAFRGAPIGQPLLGLGRAGICPNGSDSFSSGLVTGFGPGDGYPTKMYTYWQDMWPDPNGQCWGRYGPDRSTMPYTLPMPELTKGVWHKIEFALKMNSSASAADGVQRFWIDGVKYGEWTNIRFGDPALLSLGVLQINGSGDTSQIQVLDMDDLVLTTGFPDVSQP